MKLVSFLILLLFAIMYERLKEGYYFTHLSINVKKKTTKLYLHEMRIILKECAVIITFQKIASSTWVEYNVNYLLMCFLVGLDVTKKIQWLFFFYAEVSSKDRILLRLTTGNLFFIGNWHLTHLTLWGDEFDKRLMNDYSLEYSHLKYFKLIEKFWEILTKNSMKFGGDNRY